MSLVGTEQIPNPLYCLFQKTNPPEQPNNIDCKLYWRY